MILKNDTDKIINMNDKVLDLCYVYLKNYIDDDDIKFLNELDIEQLKIDFNKDYNNQLINENDIIYDLISLIQNL
jgi:hypothetical protein